MLSLNRKSSVNVLQNVLCSTKINWYGKYMVYSICELLCWLILALLEWLNGWNLIELLHLCFYAKRLLKVGGSNGSNALVGCAPCPSGLTVVPQQGLRGAFAVWSRSLGAACASVADAAVIATVALSQRSASVHAALHTAKTQCHF